LGLNRASAYYQLRYSQREANEKADLKIKDAIDQIHLEYPYYGYRPMKHALNRMGVACNQKKVYRIMRKYGLLSQIKKLFRSFTNSKHKFPRYPNLIQNLNIESLNQVWGADITYIRLREEFVYLAVVIDFHSRKIKGWALSRHLDASLPKEALQKALAHNPQPEIHHSDQGVQYCCQDYVQTLKIQISMSDKGNPYQNNVTESFFKTLKYNEVYLNEYEDFKEAFANIENFIDLVYNQKRLHSSLGYLPPEEFEQNQQNAKNLKPLKILTIRKQCLLIPAKKCQN
jgi:putative transposase